MARTSRSTASAPHRNAKSAPDAFFEHGRGYNRFMRLAARSILATLLLAFSFAASALAMPDFGPLEQKLKLKPAQKAQFSVAVAATQRALLNVALTGMDLKDKLGYELSRPRPDLNAIYAANEAMVEQNRPLFNAARIEWQRLYALLDDNQVEVARAFVEERFAGLGGIDGLGNLLRGYLPGS